MLISEVNGCRRVCDKLVLMYKSVQICALISVTPVGFESSQLYLSFFFFSLNAALPYFSFLLSELSAGLPFS